MTLDHERYIENYVIPEIVAQLDNEELESVKIENSAGIDGFMSCIFTIHLKTKSDKGTTERLHFAKFLRGTEEFKESSKSYTQFANEVYTYRKVIPTYEKFLKEMGINLINVKDLVPPVNIAKFGYIEGLSSSPDEREACLVLENLRPLGYKMGPRLVLNYDHLSNMCIPLAKFHALSYALKALNRSEFENLKSGIVEFEFLNESDPSDTKSMSRVLHRHAFDRLFEFCDRKIESGTFNKTSKKDLKLIEDLKNLKEKYFELPSRLQERNRTKVNDLEEDQYFGAIIHGDFNRNNVLFKYKSGGHEVEDVKLIDFQQLRYGSPVLDLSFFMYFNTDEKQRYQIWPDLLKTYHNTMFSTLSQILKASSKSPGEITDILDHYSFAKFQSHFARFAFYGVIICLHFLPWILSSDAECARISELFSTDFHGEEFRKLSLEAGGDEVNMRLLAIVRHASEMGYMEDL